MEKTIALKDIKMDKELVAMRGLDLFAISRYRQNYREGAKFPRITIDEKGTIVSGNHRFQAMLKEFKEDHKIKVNVKTFKTEVDRLKFFAKENACHGVKLSSIARRDISLKLMNLGAKVEEVSSIFNIPVKSVLRWGENNVLVQIGKKVEPRQIKNGPEFNKETPVPEKVFLHHRKADVGMSPLAIANQLTQWLKSDMVEDNDINRDCLSLLQQQIIIFLDNKKVKAS